MSQQTTGIKIQGNQEAAYAPVILKDSYLKFTGFVEDITVARARVVHI